MHIRNILKHFFIGIFCIFCLFGSTYAAGNAPSGNIGEFGNWLNEENLEEYVEDISGDFANSKKSFEEEIASPTFVPLEVKLGLVFMEAFGKMDKWLESSLGRFAKIFLLVMYVFWVGLEAYKMIRESSDYKTVVYEIFKKGIIMGAWFAVLEYGPAKILNMLIGPVLALATSLSDFILDTTASVYNTNIPDTCRAIHNYVNSSDIDTVVVDANTAANIMCLPGRISKFFYHAIGLGFKWMFYGFGHSLTAVIIGAVSIFVFAKCVFKYAFMTLGVVTDLFLTLLMLPFTAIAESMPASKESNYAGQIFSGLLKLFNTKKLSEVISKFANAAVYFVSLAIVISICAVLLSNIMSIDTNGSYSVAAAMTSLLTGCLILYLANKADNLATTLGGKIDNSFGKTLQSDTKTLWSGAKKIGGMIFKDWIKK